MSIEYLKGIVTSSWGTYLDGRYWEVNISECASWGSIICEIKMLDKLSSQCYRYVLFKWIRNGVN